MPIYLPFKKRLTMLCLSAFELYSRWVLLFTCYRHSLYIYFKGS